MTNLEDVRRISLTLPGATAGTSEFVVNGKGFAWTYMQRVAARQPRVARPDVLAVRTANNDEKEALIASDPAKFFTDAHYNGYPAVLVNLAAIDADELTELLIDGWRTRATRKMIAEFDAAQSTVKEAEA